MLTPANWRHAWIMTSQKWNYQSLANCNKGISINGVASIFAFFDFPPLPCCLSLALKIAQKFPFLNSHNRWLVHLCRYWNSITINPKLFKKVLFLFWLVLIDWDTILLRTLHAALAIVNTTITLVFKWFWRWFPSNLKHY